MSLPTVTCKITAASGELVQEQSYVIDTLDVEKVGNTLNIMGRRFELELEFDPPLLVDLREPA